MRIEKYLVSTGKYSRRDAKRMIAEGRVSLDGDTLLVDGREEPHGAVWIALNKPRGYVCSTDDPASPTVTKLLPDRFSELFCVGRLDKDSTGLVILTNDGKTAHFVSSPNSHICKKYRVELDGAIPDSVFLTFESGVKLADGYVCKPAKVAKIAPNSCFVTLTEGKYHQIKRMFGAMGLGVVALARVSIGEVTCEGLETGAWRVLSAAEVLNLCSLYKK